MMKRTKAVSSLVGSVASLTPWTFFRIAPIWGSYLSFFTASQIIVPLAGAYSARRALIATWAVKTLVYASTHALSPLFALGYHLPTTTAALYLAHPITTRSRIVTSTLFSISALIFSGAVGITPALWYTLLWVIPALLGAYGASSLFARATVATFLAHAVGSALWAWTFPLAPSAWVALIPVALAERTVYASGIMCGILCINWAGAAYTAHRSTVRVA
jgi:hypothetical protein